MPNCFTLTHKGENKPSTFQDIDEAMCKFFGAPVHPDDWYRNWYNTVGIGLAVGNSWDKLREIFDDLDDLDDLDDVIDWLELNYTADAWCERGGR